MLSRRQWEIDHDDRSVSAMARPARINIMLQTHEALSVRAGLLGLHLTSLAHAALAAFLSGVAYCSSHSLEATGVTHSPTSPNPNLLALALAYQP